jgi:hypothetical protein
MILPKRVEFPQGALAIKAQWILMGFEKLGVEVKKADQDPEIRATPFNLIMASGKKIKCWHDGTCNYLRTALPEWYSDGSWCFKTHLIYPAGRVGMLHLRSMPQAMGFPDYRSCQEKLIAARAAGERESDVIGLFANNDKGLRIKACRMLKDLEGKRWRIRVSMNKQRTGRQPIPPDLFTDRLNRAEHYQALAAADLSLCLPGGINSPWSSYRHVESWSLGVPVLTIPIPQEYEFNGREDKCWIEMAPDLSDMVEKIEYYLANPEAAEAIGWAGLQHFNKWHTPEAHARYVMRTLEEAGEL